MPSSVSVGAGPVTRTYCVLKNGRRFVVSLFHNTITGERALSIDGVEVPG